MSTGLLKNKLYLNFYYVNHQERRVVHEYLKSAVPKIVFRMLPPSLSKPRRGSGRGKI